jgi:hypothetical protein
VIRRELGGDGGEEVLGRVAALVVALVVERGLGEGDRGATASCFAGRYPSTAA